VPVWRGKNFTESPPLEADVSAKSWRFQAPVHTAHNIGFTRRRLRRLGLRTVSLDLTERKSMGRRHILRRADARLRTSRSLSRYTPCAYRSGIPQKQTRS